MRAVVMVIGIFALGEPVYSGNLDVDACRDPLIFRDATQRPICAPGSSDMSEFEDLVSGSSTCIGTFTSQAAQETITLCDNSCTCSLSWQADDLAVNVSSDLLCGNYTVQVSEMPVSTQSLGSCVVAVDAKLDLTANWSGSYIAPGTWTFDNPESVPEITEFSISGCSNPLIAGSLSLIETFILEAVETLLAEGVNGYLLNASSKKWCPVDSLHPSLQL